MTAWASPHPGHEGAAWCTTCLPAEAHAEAMELPDHPIHPAARDTQAARLALPTSRWGECRLCGQGEAGSEHLIRWCSAVHRAWTDIRAFKGPSTMATAIALAGPVPRRLRIFLHQVAFL